MDFSIDKLRAALSGGGARPTLFSVQLNSPMQPTLPNLGLNSPFMVKAANLPQSTIGEILISYMGRKLKAAGDRTYQDWQVTVNNDENFSIRNDLESWSNAIQGPASNIRNSGADASFSYKAQAIVSQYSKDDSDTVIAEYTFYGLWPKEIGIVELSWEAENQIESFQVQFAYDYFTRTA